MQYASAGVGSFMHMGPELFKLMAKVDILHVPFRGAGPALIDVIGGDTHMSFASVPSSITHFRSGKLRAVAVGSKTRNALIPDVPTIDESGLPGYEFANWIGIVAPAGTPARHRREAAQGADGDPELARNAEGVCERGRRDRADELGRIRQVHRVGNGQMGTRGEGRRHQAAVIAASARPRSRQFGPPCPAASGEHSSAGAWYGG